MTELEFLNNHIFDGLTNLNKDAKDETEMIFSEVEFNKILGKCAEIGIGVYTIQPFNENETLDVLHHEKFRKKATDPKWFTKAFKTSSIKTPGLTYSGTYKVSAKLLTKSFL